MNILGAISGIFITARKKGHIQVKTKREVLKMLFTVLTYSTNCHIWYKRADETVIFDKEAVNIVEGCNSITRCKRINNLVIVKIAVDFNKLNSDAHLFQSDKTNNELCY